MIAESRYQEYATQQPISINQIKPLKSEVSDSVSYEDQEIPQNDFVAENARSIL